MLPPFFHQTPFFRLLLPFAAGIVAGFQIPVPPVYCAVACAGSAVCLCMSVRSRNKPGLYRRDWLYGVFLYLFLVAAGIGVASETGFIPSDRTEQGIWLAVVEEPPTEKENSMKTTIRIRENLSDTSTVHEEKVTAYFRKDDRSRNIRQGDLLLLNAVLKPVTNAGNPYEFDYRGYLNRKHIGRSVFAESADWRQIDEYAQGPLMNLSNKIRSSLLDIYKRAGLNGDELAVASALVLGYKADLDDDLRGAYAASGAMHVLAVSGLHVGIVYLILSMLLKPIPFRGRAKLLRALILLAALWLYALITGMSPSVMRAATMFSFIIAGEAFRRKVSIYNSIAASAFILLCIRPANLFDVGFQLSYAAVIAIVFFHPKFYGLLSFKRRLPDYVWSLTCVSLAAQIGTLPLSLYYFHQFPVYFALSNLVVIPGASIIIYGSLLLFIVSPVSFLLNAVGRASDMFLYGLNFCIFSIEKLPGSLVWGIRFQAWEILSMYLLAVTLSAWALSARKMYLFASFVLCLVWIAGADMRAYQDLSRRQFLVYHVSGSSLLQFIDGRNNTVWYESRNPSFNASLSTEHRRIAGRLNEPECVFLDSALLRSTPNCSNIYAAGNFVQFANKRLAIFTRNRPLKDAGDSFVKTDVAVLTRNADVRIAQLMKTCRPDVVVIDASNSFGRIERWEKDCLEQGVKCYRTDRDGAFVLRAE